MKCFKHISKRQARILRYVLAFLLIIYFFCLPRRIFDEPTSTLVLDRSGELLGARIASDGQWRFSPTNEIPEKLKQCMIAFEDDYFYYHWGVNPFSIGKAFLSNMKAKSVVRGGSTITMQVIRLSRNEKRTVYEKVIEAILATRLEFRYSKEEILNLYASYAPFGGNVVGYSAASWRYFGHTATNLSWAEAATLAVLPNSPSAIHLARKRDALKEKRNRLLQKLHRKNLIDDYTLELALEEDIPDKPIALPQIAPHLVSQMNSKYPGVTTTSTIDISIQQKVEGVANRWNREYRKHNINDIAAVVLDVETGEIIAYHGNSGFETNRGGSQVDIVDAPRSTGSVLKPFLFASMLDEGLLLPNQLVPDIPMKISGFSPQNFNLKYEGAVKASEALSRSLNLPSVVLLRDYTYQKFYDKLKLLKFTTLNQPASYYGLSIILGGSEGKLIDVASAYMHLGQIATQQPTTLLKTRLDEESTPWPPQYTAGAAWQTLSILTEVNRPGEIAWKRMPSMQMIGWKTGTSQGFRDAWAVGVNKKHVIAVWVGNATGEGNPELIGGRVAGPVLFELFNIFQNEQWIDRPANQFVDAEVCHQSGFLKSRFCSDIDTVLVAPNAAQNTDLICPYHHLVTLTADGKNRVYQSCAGEEGIIQKSWFTLPPVWEWFYVKAHPEYEVLPPFKKGCGEDSMSTMQFIYPYTNADLIITKQFDGSYGPVVFELAHIDPNAQVFWHLDGHYIGETTYIHQQSLVPEDGHHVMAVVDGLGNTTSVSFSSTLSK